MEKCDFVPFVKIILTLAELYDIEMSEVRQAEYFNALFPFSIEAVAFSAKYCRDHGMFFPRVSEMMEAARMYRSATSDPAKMLPERTCPAMEPGLKQQYEADAQYVIKKINAGMPHRDRVDLMLSMESAYPGYGWQQEAESMEVEYRKRGFL